MTPPIKLRPFSFLSDERTHTDIRNGRTNKRTILRKYVGDVDALKEAMAAELEEKTGKKMEVISYHGRLEVKGHHQDVLKAWLTRLGF